MELYKLTGRKIIAIILFLMGIIGIIICSHLSSLPISAEQESGYISPFGAEIAAIYPGYIFLIFLSLALLIKRTVIKTVLLLVGMFVMYEYIQIFLIGAYNFCVDVCIDDKDAVIAITNHILLYYYILGVICIFGVILIDLLLKQKKSKK